MNSIIGLEEMQQFCRICLTLTPNLIPFSTNLVSESYICRIVDILNKISIVDENPNYPTGICLECKKEVTATFILKMKFERSTETLKECVKFKEEATDSQLTFQNFEITETHSQFETDGEYELEGEAAGIVENMDIKEEFKPVNVTEYISEPRVHRQLIIRSYNKLHVCPVCLKEFENPMDFKRHVHSHKTLKTYLQAKKLPPNAVIVANHFKSKPLFNGSKVVHACPICEVNLPAEKFRIHVLNHRAQEQFACEKCDRVFRKDSHLNIHKVRTHLDEYPYKCELCQKGFVIKRNYDCHLLTHTEKELPHKCEFCTKSFANPEHLHRHQFVHTENITYGLKYKVNRCYLCKRTFSSMEELQQHRLQCRHVGSKTNTKGGRKAFPSTFKKYQCPLCFKKYSALEGLDIHTRKVHITNENPKILCTICGKCVSNIHIHMASHSGEKPYQCTLCPKTFATKTVLKQHLLVHSGQKPFVCSSCGKAFNNYYNLQVHERIHKGDKCHKCLVCGKGFLERSYLNKHMKVHTKV